MKTIHLATLLLTATAAIAQTYTIQERGPTCHADLSAQLVTVGTTPGIRLGIHSMPHSIAVLAIGPHAPSPIALPYGPCEFFVRPVSTVLGTTDANGNAPFAFRIPPVLPLHVLFQGAVLSLTPHGLALGSTDVVVLDGQ
ncbi:MAG: hypothetical protein KDC98_06535 [Planctomycetes bacterium]|nr:hypothetical protein [Planctomycetota bacterium]